MSAITYDDRARVWLLTLASTSYAFALTEEGALRHLHWGAPLGEAAAAELAVERQGRRLRRARDLAWSDDAPDEYVGWGAMRYDEPTLKLRHADGDRGVALSYREHRISAEPGAVRLEVDLVDGERLAVTLCYRISDGFDVLERWARVVNSGTAPVDLDLAYSADLWLPRRETSWQMRYLHGGWAMESRIGEVCLSAPGKFTLESRRGTTSHQFTPWFALAPRGPGGAGAATEESGEVWSGQLAWSGSWKLVAERTHGGQVHVVGGWNDFDLDYRLEPGEQVTLPVFAALHTVGGYGAASREWHAWTNARVLGRGDTTDGVPRRWPAGEPAVRHTPAAERTPPARLVEAAPWRPVLYNSWEATAFDVTEQGQAALAQRAARIGVELFVVDDGWFTGRTSGRAGLGDWHVDPAKFPRGLAPLIETVQSHGMGFGLWVEPEMVNPDSDLYRAHPDWVYHFPGREPAQRRHQLMLNLARTDVADFVLTTLDGLLTRYDIAFLKWDANRNIADAGWPGHPQPERLWVEHTVHLYAILDALRTAHPGVAIEGCSGGGGRNDLGMLARVAEVWPSDNTEPTMRWPIQDGFSQAFPPSVMASWVTDWRHPGLSAPLPLSYRFHVAMAGVLGIGGDLTAWSEEELAEAALHVARYRQIRPIVQGGRLYRHDRCWEYVGPGGSEVVVIAIWEPRAIGNDRPPLRLVGVDAAAGYRDDVTGRVHRGDLLLRDGLPLAREEEFGFGSALVRLVRL